MTEQQQPEETYTTVSIDLSGMTDAQKLAVSIVMNEGKLRERERITRLFENIECDGSENCECPHGQDIITAIHKDANQKDKTMSDTPVYDEVKKMFVECHDMWVKDGIKYERNEIVNIIKEMTGTGITKAVKEKIIKAIERR